MAYETGTATNFANLHSRLITFLTTNLGADNWTLHYGYERGDGVTIDPSPVFADEQVTENRCILRATGTGGSDEIFVGLSTYREVTAAHYTLVAKGFSSVNPSLPYYGQANSSEEVCLYAWDQPMDYWIVASGRKFILVVKVNSVYQIMYAGFFLPYALPSEYGYPYLVGGCGFEPNKVYTETGRDNAAFFQGYYKNAQILLPSNEWKYAGNYILESETDNQDNAAHVVNFHPYFSDFEDYYYNPIIREIKPNLDGSYHIFPICPHSFSSVGITAIFGALDGVHQVSGFNNSAENIITINAVTYVVFNNVTRTAVDQFYCVRLD